MSQATVLPMPEQLPPFRCEECLRGPEKTKFLYNDSGDPSSLCVECQTRRMAQRHFARQEKEQNQDVMTLLRMGVRQRIHLPSMNEAVRQFAAKYGGLGPIIDIIYTKLNGILEMDDAPPRLTLDTLRFLVGFLKAGMPEVETTLDASAMSDDELESILRTYVLETLGSNLSITDDPERRLTCKQP